MNFRKPRPEEPEINLIPFIDVLLVVLIFLMLSTTYSKFTELQISCRWPTPRRRATARARSSSRWRPTAATRSTASRSTAAASRRSRPSSTAAAAGSSDMVVIVSADATAAHQSVINVMDAARRAGLRAADLRDPVRRPARRADARARRAPRRSPLAARLALRAAARLARGRVAARAAAAAVVARSARSPRCARRCTARGWLRDRPRLPVPVMVVGNLVAGGAGKTPTVIAVVDAAARARLHAGRGLARLRPARRRRSLEVGRGRRARDVGDEPLLMQPPHRRAGGRSARDRVAAGRAAAAARIRAVDVIVSDDGLQHLRLARDVEVLVFDERGAGNGWLLPAGPLREPLPRGARPAPARRSTTPTRRRRRLPGSLAGARSPASWRWPVVARRRRHARRRSRRCAAARSSPRPAWRGPSASSRCCASTACASPSCRCPTTTTTRPCPGRRGTADVVVTEKDAVKLAGARRTARASGSRR